MKEERWNLSGWSKVPPECHVSKPMKEPSLSALGRSSDEARMSMRQGIQQKTEEWSLEFQPRVPHASKGLIFVLVNWDSDGSDQRIRRPRPEPDSRPGSSFNVKFDPAPKRDLSKQQNISLNYLFRKATVPKRKWVGSPVGSNRSRSRWLNGNIL
jgi:hypothetical protein